MNATHSLCPSFSMLWHSFILSHNFSKFLLIPIHIQMRVFQENKINDYDSISFVYVWNNNKKKKIVPKNITTAKTQIDDKPIISNRDRFLVWWCAQQELIMIEFQICACSFVFFFLSFSSSVLVYTQIHIHENMYVIK